jgi:hypothetical protein
VVTPSGSALSLTRGSRSLIQRLTWAPAGQVVSRVASLVPVLTSGVLHLVQQLALPDPAGTSQHGGEGAPGYRLTPAVSRKAFDRLTVLGRAAASRFNERRSSARS